MSCSFDLFANSNWCLELGLLLGSLFYFGWQCLHAHHTICDDNSHDDDDDIKAQTARKTCHDDMLIAGNDDRVDLNPLEKHMYVVHTCYSLYGLRS